MESRDAFQVHGSQSVPDLENQLNFVLQRLYDRLDQIEGNRGESKIVSVLDMSEQRVKNLAAPVDDNDAVRKIDIEDLAGSGSPTFTNITVTGLATILQLEVESSIVIKDSFGTIIHEMSLS